MVWLGLKACQGLLVGLGELVSVFLWVKLDLLSLECKEVPSSEFGVSMGLA